MLVACRCMSPFVKNASDAARVPSTRGVSRAAFFQSYAPTPQRHGPGRQKRQLRADDRERGCVNAEVNASRSQRGHPNAAASKFESWEQGLTALTRNAEKCCDEGLPMLASSAALLRAPARIRAAATKALEGLPRRGGGRLPARREMRARFLRAAAMYARRGRQQVRTKAPARPRAPARTASTARLQGLGDERRRDDGAAPALQEPRGGRQQVRRKRQHVRAGRRERPRPRCLQGRGDERRRDDGAGQLYKNHGADGSKSDESASTRARAGENGLDRAASKGIRDERRRRRCYKRRGDGQLYKNHGADGSKSDESGSTSARAGENGLDRAASKVFATSVAATTARAPLYEPRADGQLRRSETMRGTSRALDRAASQGFATSVAATMARLQLYKNYGADGLYADAFDSETIKGAAKAELDLNKYQAGGVRALHAIEQVSYVQYENYRLNGSDAGANSETVTAWAAGRASVLPQVDQLSTSAARPRVKEVSATPAPTWRSAQALFMFGSRRCSAQ